MPSSRVLFDAFIDELDLPRMLAQTETLWRIEGGQRTCDYRRAARFVEQLLTDTSLQRVQRLTFPADGKTTCLDHVMPLAWHATVGRLTVTRAPLHFDDPVVADYHRHPFHLIKGSVGTPDGGTPARLISEEQMYAGEDARGAMIILAPETRPSGQVVRDLCDLGALGLVSDYLKHRYDTPDGVCWVNACTEGSHWHVHEDDRPFIGFSVSPRTGDQLRAAVRAGRVQVQVESDGRRYADELDLVTGVLPGDEPRELWLLSHLYEPMPNDNATGCIAAIEILRAMQRMIEDGRLPRPRFTLRVVLGMELYGFAAYAQHRGPTLSDQVLGALNMDSIIGHSETLRLAPAALPFCGDYVMEELSRACQPTESLPPQLIDDHGYYADDALMNDPTLGVPTVWPFARAPLWHNSQQVMSTINPQQYLASAAFRAAWAGQMAMLQGQRLERQVQHAALLAEEHLHQEASAILRSAAADESGDPDGTLQQARRFMGYRCQREVDRLADFGRYGDVAGLQAVQKRVQRTADSLQHGLNEQLRDMFRSRGSTQPTRSQPHRLAGTIVPARATRGFPHDLARLPKNERPRMSGLIALYPVLAGMDGERNLEAIVEEAAWQSGEEATPALMRRCIGAVNLLTEYGYLNTRYEHVVTRQDMVAALRRVGLDTGDLVLLHSALSPLGHVEGAAEAVIDAVLEVIGDSGTLLMPTFSRSVVAEGIGSGARRFRPYHPKTSPSWTGLVPTRFLQRPHVLRSAHPTHSVAGVGPLAAACLREHREGDPPFSSRSPLAHMLANKGKVVWLGADVSAVSLIHLVEDQLQMPFLADVLCRVERADGDLETVHVPGYPAGHRDYYRTPGEQTKIYRRLLTDGLAIHRTPLGLDAVKLVHAPEMHRLTLAALSEHPDLLLCDQPTCGFCQRHRATSGSSRL